MRWKVSLVKGLVESEDIGDDWAIIFSNSVHLTEEFNISILVFHANHHVEEVHEFRSNLEHVCLQRREESISNIVTGDVQIRVVVDVVLNELSESAVLKVVIQDVHKINSSLISFWEGQVEVQGFSDKVL